ncbi:MAG: AsnC family protein [gamma proteobacterium symbiont of Lucinoma myriamae]|nr:AsnC family protein [gamma proteobacterium symbiont of Lucinoma myriamae]MCU7819496.1 AsnC family protein [gamma proteobacterium symbiont of Lucinoma myriamae]MCU7832553.1 AsnC family protein [gamma proteobacterium symbiont of Lucinoma myriamae]
MTLELLDQQLIANIQDGLELTSKPFASIAAQLGISEQKVIKRMEQLKDNGTIKRLGVVVRHRELGFKANAMVVWDIPDDSVAQIAQRIASFDCVTLCYQRPRRLPYWSYNLFSMIHGKDRDSVLERLANLVELLELQDIEHTPLFSTKCFKQRGARYIDPDKIISGSISPLPLLSDKQKVSSPSAQEFILPIVKNHAYG